MSVREYRDRYSERKALGRIMGFLVAMGRRALGKKLFCYVEVGTGGWVGDEKAR